MNRILRCRLPTMLSLNLILAAFPQADAAEEPAAVIRSLQGYHHRVDRKAIDLAWPHLDDAQASVREAARLAITAQPLAQWKDRALEEKATWASLEALRALAEACPPTQTAELSPYLCEHLTTLRIEQMDEAQQQAALRLTRLIFTRLAPTTEDERQQMIDLWTHLQPTLPASLKTQVKDLVDFLSRVAVRRS